jgi:hypothetical protein
MSQGRSQLTFDGSLQAWPAVNRHQNVLPCRTPRSLSRPQTMSQHQYRCNDKDIQRNQFLKHHNLLVNAFELCVALGSSNAMELVKSSTAGWGDFSFTIGVFQTRAHGERKWQKGRFISHFSQSSRRSELRLFLATSREKGACVVFQSFGFFQFCLPFHNIFDQTDLQGTRLSNNTLFSSRSFTS